MKKAVLLSKLLAVYAVIIAMGAILILNSFQNQAAINTYIKSVRTSELTETLQINQQESAYPVRITIPAIYLSLPVTKGTYDQKKKQWLVSNSSANFAVISALPNTFSGNTLIYGHNFENVLGPTKKLKTGDRLYVQTANKRVFEYEYTNDQVVLPDNLEVFRYDGAPKVTLLTCTGTWDSQRRLMNFKLRKVA